MRNKWTDEELDILRNNWHDNTALELSKLIPEHPADSIRKKRKQLGLHLTKEDRSNRARYAHSFVNFDNICKLDQGFNLDDLDDIVFQVLIGSMLGDGSVNKQTKNLRNHRFTEGHGEKQADYVTWKARQLSVFQPRMVGNCSLVTMTHPIFTNLRDKFYKSHRYSLKSVMPIDIVSKIDLFGFLIWYLDDGNIGPFANKPQMTIGAKGWDSSGLVELVKVINSKFGLAAYVYVSQKNKVVKIPARDRSILIGWRELAKKHNIPACMNYKLGL